MEPSKRELRQQKREIKRAGGKRRRRIAKRLLAEHPEDAPSVDPAFEFGRYSSSPFNGMDQDATRRRVERTCCPDSSASRMTEKNDAPGSNTA